MIQKDMASFLTKHKLTTIKFFRSLSSFVQGGHNNRVAFNINGIIFVVFLLGKKTGIISYLYTFLDVESLSH